MQQEMHYCECENSRRDIIEHNSSAFWKFLQLPHRRRFDDVERSKKYKTRKKSFPCEGDGNQRNQLPGNLVDDDELRILHSCRARYTSRGRDTDQRDQRGQGDGSQRAQGRRKFVRDGGPDHDRCSRRPGAGARAQPADAEEGRDQRGPEWSANGWCACARCGRGRWNLRGVHDSSSASSGLLSRIDSSASAVGDEMT